MKFIILSLFPEAFKSYLSSSLIGRALSKKIISVSFSSPRDYALDAHKTVDDRPYGGGVGMIMRYDIFDKTLAGLKLRKGQKGTAIILLTPQGKVFTQKTAKKLSSLKRIVLICGRYEGFDERIRSLVDFEISMGDFVLTGGEIPALAVLDAVTRLISGVVGKRESLVLESFSEKILEYPQYTRPPIYKNKKVPQILLSGDHKKIEKWRTGQALKKTRRLRPDLLK
jgi:tRNA (guanine37-N1)-methyltransferase